MSTDRHTRARGLAGLVAAALVAGAGSAAAAPNAATDWNRITVTIVASAGPLRPGPSGILDIAMVQAAIHDAVQAYQNRFESYNTPITGAAGTPAAAVAKAARDVLVHRLPSLAGSVDAAYNNFLLANGLAANDPGAFVGQQAAANVINARLNDGSFPSNPETFTGGTAPGQWRPTGPLFLPMAAPWLGGVAPFALKDSDKLLPEPPPPHLTSGEYANAYDEVKRMGARFGSERTPAQTDLAYFYSGNIIAQMNEMVRNVAIANLDDLGDTARLLALASIAGADTVISAWQNKRSSAFWRPSTAINNGDNDGNKKTEGDASWLPLINNPPYPDYTSGANSLTGAATRVLSNFFGDEMTFTVSTAVPQATTKVRTYHRFSEVADDMVEARILLGIHFRFADTVARRQGKQSADWAFSHILKPIQ